MWWLAVFITGRGPLPPSLAVLVFFVLTGSATGKGPPSMVDKAIEDAFPGAVVKKKRLFLKKDEVKRIEELSGAKVSSRLFTYYSARSDAGPMGYAVIGRHTVRTKPEVYMLVTGPGLSVRHIRILAFYEPEEYRPMKRWLDQFRGKRLGERLWIRRDIQAITGATITSYTLTREIRRVLATLELMLEKETR